MIAGAKKTGKMTLIDPKGEDFSKYRGATILTPNKSELRQVVGSWKDESELTVKAQNLRESLDLEYLLLTRSEEGMSLYGATEVLHIPTVAREVFDVSGAGDTVIATLATMIGNGKPVAEAVRNGNRYIGRTVFFLIQETRSSLAIPRSSSFMPNRPKLIRARIFALSPSRLTMTPSPNFLWITA